MCDYNATKIDRDHTFTIGYPVNILEYRILKI